MASTSAIIRCQFCGLGGDTTIDSEVCARYAHASRGRVLTRAGVIDNLSGPTPPCRREGLSPSSEAGPRTALRAPGSRTRDLPVAG
jgi:hypothetical protein